MACIKNSLYSLYICSKSTERMDTRVAFQHKQVVYFDYGQFNKSQIINRKSAKADKGSVSGDLLQRSSMWLSRSSSLQDKAGTYTLPDWSDCEQVPAIRPNPPIRSGVLPTCPYSLCRPDAARPPTMHNKRAVQITLTKSVHLLIFRLFILLQFKFI
jgi:hypothetical protein